MNNREKGVIVGLVAAAAIGGGAWWWYANQDPPWVTACEEGVRQMLKSPSSFKRIELTGAFEQMVILRYEAMNGFGAMQAGRANCKLAPDPDQRTGYQITEFILNGNKLPPDELTLVNLRIGLKKL